MEKNVSINDFKKDSELLNSFALIDDNDLISAIKTWQFSEDKVLSKLCKAIISRKLFKTEISKDNFSKDYIQQKISKIKSVEGFNDEECSFFYQIEKLINNAYDAKTNQILILSRNGKIQDLTEASDNLNITSLSTPVEKTCFCYLNICQ